jgi:Polymer-forming cytoskeletal
VARAEAAADKRRPQLLFQNANFALDAAHLCDVLGSSMIPTGLTCFRGVRNGEQRLLVNTADEIDVHSFVSRTLRMVASLQWRLKSSFCVRRSMFESGKEKTVIAKGLKIVGSVTAEGLVEVNGQIDGELHGTSLVISHGAEVAGTVTAERVVVDGKV